MAAGGPALGPSQPLRHSGVDPSKLSRTSADGGRSAGSFSPESGEVKWIYWKQSVHTLGWTPSLFSHQRASSSNHRKMRTRHP